ncbi:hypothetical protein EAI_12720, partial [Harpegnathos saltator]
DRYLDDHLLVVAVDIAVEEKSRIAGMAAATLHKLRHVIQQMKNWRDDSARLKSNIWRMKMALRADDKNGNDNLEIDPLIVHQRTEISRLEQANDALGNELEHESCAKTASLLNDFLSKIDTEVGKLKLTSIDRYCRIGGISGSRYMTKIAELEDLVKKSVTVIAALHCRWNRQDPLETADATERIVEELGDLIERLCRKLKDLEILDDRASLRERIGRLEVSIVRLRLELTEKNERVSALNDECGRVRSTLEDERGKHEQIVADMSRENERLREDANSRKRDISELSRERAQSEGRVAKMRLMTVEIDTLGKKLRRLRDDKETLLGRAEKMRNILRERDKEIANIITGRDSLKAVLGAEVKDLKMKLGIAADENVKLKSIIGGLGKRRRRRQRQRLDKLKSSRKDPASNLRDELKRLKAESNESKISLDEANGRITRLKRALDEALGDRARLHDEVSDLKSNEESLTYRLNVQTSAGEEAAGERGRLMETNKVLEGKMKHLRDEKEQLKAELSESRAEKGSLERSMNDANNKCAALQDRVRKFQCELSGLREKVTEREAAMEDFKLELEKARTDLEDAAIQVSRLKAENSRLTSDLDVLSEARCAEADGRVRVLLAEKNELTTRINELDDENAGLRDRWNKTKAEDEYLSMELNKSRVENDKVRAINALLQLTCNKRLSENDELTRERDEARRRLNEIGSDRRLEIHVAERETLRIAAVASYCEKNDRESHLKRIDTRHPLANGHERGLADLHNKLRHKLDYLDAARTSIKVEIDGGKDNDTTIKAESDTCSGPDGKIKIKDRPKGGLRRLARTENKVSTLEPANYGAKNGVVTMELARAEDESESPIRPAAGELGDEEIIDFIESASKRRRELVNIRYTPRMNNYTGHSGDSKMFGDKVRSQVADIDQLEVENRALKMEVDILRDSLDFSLVDGERTRTGLAKATEEIRALKSELMNLRDEKTTLRSRLETFKEELNGFKSERTALKDELVASRKSNFDLRLKANNLRSAVEKLKETNARLEGGLRNALRE